MFQAITLAQEADDAPDWALRELRELDDWFTRKLARPVVFVKGGDRYRSRRAQADSQTGLSWFRPTATTHIARMWRLKAALEACGVHVEVLTTHDPVAIVWQDAHQVVTQPGGRRF